MSSTIDREGPWARHAATADPASGPRASSAHTSVCSLAVFIAGSGLVGCLRTEPPAPPSAATQTATDPAPAARTRVRAIADPAVEIEAGPDHFCARLASRRVVCWGNNDREQLGDGTRLPTDGPVLIEGLEGVERLHRGAMCAHTSQGSNLCWGERTCKACENVAGTPLWRASAATDTTPAPGDDALFCAWDGGRSGDAAPDPRPPAGRTAAVIRVDASHPRAQATAFGHTCAAAADGQVHCCQKTGDGQATLGARPLAGVRLDGKPSQLALAVTTACALLEGGEIWCWDLFADRAGPPTASAIDYEAAARASLVLPHATSAAQLRETLVRADDPRALARISRMDQGVELGHAVGARWHPDETACFVEQLDSMRVVERVQGDWACNEQLTRCVARHTNSATAFYWDTTPQGDRKLSAIVEFERPVDVETAIRTTRHAPPWIKRCDLWRAVSRRDAGLTHTEVTVLNHPAVDFADVPGPAIRHHCGQEVHEVTWDRTVPGPYAEDWTCEGLTCSYNAGQGARGVFVFVLGPDGEPKISVVGEDLDPAIASDRRGPMLDKAIAAAKRRRCPPAATP